jgi:hypothetical protein
MNGKGARVTGGGAGDEQAKKERQNPHPENRRDAAPATSGEPRHEESKSPPFAKRERWGTRLIAVRDLFAQS